MAKQDSDGSTGNQQTVQEKVTYNLNSHYPVLIEKGIIPRLLPGIPVQPVIAPERDYNHNQNKQGHDNDIQHIPVFQQQSGQQDIHVQVNPSEIKRQQQPADIPNHTAHLIQKTGAGQIRHIERHKSKEQYQQQMPPEPVLRSYQEINQKAVIGSFRLRHNRSLIIIKSELSCPRA